MFGSGGTTNKTSRLYRALVEGEISVSAYGTLQATHDPYLYSINLTVHPNHTPDEVLAAVDDEINKVLNSPVTQDEISRAIKQAKPYSPTAVKIYQTRLSGWDTRKCSQRTIGLKIILVIFPG